MDSVVYFGSYDHTNITIKFTNIEDDIYSDKTALILFGTNNGKSLLALLRIGFNTANNTRVVASCAITKVLDEAGNVSISQKDNTSFILDNLSAWGYFYVIAPTGIHIIAEYDG